MKVNKKERVIIALDLRCKKELDYYLDVLSECQYFKVGMESYYRFGTTLLERLKKDEKKIFLDLKLHDIPNTIERALSVLNTLDIDMVNVHALGGVSMMERARKAIGSTCKLIAVTILTSHEEAQLQNELGLDLSLNKLVMKLTKNAYNAGLDGVVCSPFEAKIIKENFGNNFLTVTPGIRNSTDLKDDQKRVMTPKLALKNGTDHIVLGRAITQAQNPGDLLGNIFKYC